MIVFSSISTFGPITQYGPISTFEAIFAFAATVTKIAALGFKDHSLQGMGLDANKNDQVPVIESLPIFGMYMPDSIDSYTFNGNTYLVTANEGDGREYIYSADSASCLNASHTDLGDDECLSYSDEISLEDLNLDTKQFSAAQIAMLQNGKGIGDLTVTKTHGDANADGAYEAIYAYGARSFSIWTASGKHTRRLGSTQATQRHGSGHRQVRPGGRATCRSTQAGELGHRRGQVRAGARKQAGRQQPIRQTIRQAGNRQATGGQLADAQPMSRQQTDNKQTMARQ